MSDDQQAEFIPTDIQQIPPLYIGFAVGYLGLTVLWCGNWIRHRKENIPLQRTLTIIPVTKFLHCLGAFGFFYDCCYNGLNSCRFSLKTVHETAYTIFEIFFVFGFNAISERLVHHEK
jgi:hypothetical protein